jgi:hypothetical protein
MWPVGGTALITHGLLSRVWFRVARSAFHRASRLCCGCHGGRAKQGTREVKTFLTREIRIVIFPFACVNWGTVSILKVLAATRNGARLEERASAGETAGERIAARSLGYTFHALLDNGGGLITFGWARKGSRALDALRLV